MSTNAGIREDWLYLRLYAGPAENTDALLPLMAAWLGPDPEYDRWHFLRYLDPSGVHIRFRMCAEPNTIDRAFRLVPKLRAGVSSVRAGRPDRVVPDPALSTLGARRGVSVGVYSPEREKYGSGAALRLAEDHFHRSSDWCLREQIWTWDIRARAAFAAAYLRALATHFGPGFLAAHRALWSPRLRLARLTAIELRSAIDTVAAAESRAGRSAAVHVGALAESLMRAMDGSCPAAALDRATHLAHMDINRLGLNPAEECLAGLVAAGSDPDSSRLIATGGYRHA